MKVTTLNIRKRLSLKGVTEKVTVVSAKLPAWCYLVSYWRLAYLVYKGNGNYNYYIGGKIIYIYNARNTYT